MSGFSLNQAATLWFLVRQIAARFDRGGDALYRERLGISLAQYLVLLIVHVEPGPLSQQAIADRLGLTKGTVSRQIDLAVAAGRLVVARSARSRREHEVRLTADGEQLVHQGDQLLAEAVTTALPSLDQADLDTTIRTLGALNRAFGGTPTPVWPDLEPR